MSHGCHKCHCPNGCRCKELADFEAAKLALGSEVATLIQSGLALEREIMALEAERSRIDERIATKRQDFLPKQERLAQLTLGKQVECDAFIKAAIALLKRY